MVYFAYATFYDTFHLIIIPITILVRSRTNYPIIWTNYKTKNIKFFTNLKPMVQPKEIREPKSACSRYLHVTSQLPEVECWEKGGSFKENYIANSSIIQIDYSPCVNMFNIKCCLFNWEFRYFKFDTKYKY